MFFFPSEFRVEHTDKNFGNAGARRMVTPNITRNING